MRSKFFMVVFSMLVGLFFSESVLVAQEQVCVSAQGYEETKGGSDNVVLPEFIKNAKFEGDMRLRYQTESRDNQNSRQRERIRVRLGVETDINADLKVGFRVATGDGNPRSTNETFDNTFEGKGIVLDQAYIKYQPKENLKITAGKFSNPFYTADDLIWDTDLNYEGQAVNFDLEINEKMDMFINAGLFVVDEVSGGSDDTYMYYVQPGFKQKVGKDMNWDFAAGYFGFSDVKGKNLANSAGSNSIKNGGLEYSYNAINLVSKLTYDWKDSKDDDYSLSFAVDYVENLDSGDNGYLLGVQYGHKKLDTRGKWQLFYNWRRLERDAFLDVFPDSDCYGGATNIQGHELGLKYVLVENMYLGLDYYYTEDLDNTNVEEHLFQADLLVKF